MIPYEIHQIARANGIVLDMLGQRLKVGDKVLTKSYGSVSHDILTTIQKINKVNLVVHVKMKRIDYTKARTLHKQGYSWPEAYRLAKEYNDDYKMSRNPSEVILFNQQAKHMVADITDLEINYPEIFI